MERKCSLCGAILRQSNPGPLCSPCQEKMRKQLESTSPYYTAKELSYILGLENEESVKRLGRQGKIPGRIPQIKRHLYSKDVVDDWIRSDHVQRVKPTSPLQAEAYELCLKGNHTWMDDDRFEGHAYTLETPFEIRNYLVMSRREKTCYFCGHVTVSPFV